MMRRICAQKGFTLVEVIVAMSVFTLISSMFARFLVYSYRQQTYDIEQGIAVKSGQTAIALMLSELREMRNSDEGAFALSAGDADEMSIVFYGDIDKDQSTERVRYFLTDKVLYRGIIEPTSDPIDYVLDDEVITVIATDIQNSTDAIFTYYNKDYPADADNNPLSDPVDVTEVELIEVHLFVNVDPDRAPANFEIQSFVHLRNIEELL